MKVEILGEIIEIPDDFIENHGSRDTGGTGCTTSPILSFIGDECGERVDRVERVERGKKSQEEKKRGFDQNTSPCEYNSTNPCNPCPTPFSTKSTKYGFDTIPEQVKRDMNATDEWLNDQYIRAGFIDGATMHQFSERFDKLAK